MSRNRNYKFVATASNLGELRKAIDAAIIEFGEDANWYGWDDESVMISDENGYDAGIIGKVSE